MKLFVYGTLKRIFRDERNNPVAPMQNVELIGEYETRLNWTLADLGPYPAMIPGNSGVVGEVWEVPDKKIEQLDRYEGVPHLFMRTDVEVAPVGSEDYEWVKTYIFTNISSLLSYDSTMREWK
jgi:gamma-glutamylcyclotransferase (GGCT)/AIG2-like uncharacterized protein YtfP